MRLKAVTLLAGTLCFALSTFAFGKTLPDTGKKVIGVVPYHPVLIARITGNSLPGETLPNPNQTAKNYDVGGADLGIMWAMGHGRIGMFFGDTFGRDWTPDSNGNDWRSNVLAFSGNHDLNNGIKFSGMDMSTDGKKARQIIYSPHNTNGKGDYTAIPTGAIRINNIDYVSYMDVRQWLQPGNWATNYSGMYRSADDGKTWQKTAIYFAHDSHFAQTAFAKKDGYVYLLGIDSGRFGPAYLCRFKQDDILHQEKYQYWSGGKWTNSAEKKATSIFGPEVSEPSLLYNTKYQLWIATYLDMRTRTIKLRYAVNITGPWSSAEALLSGSDGYDGLYGGFMYPYDSGDNLYFVISMWFKYNTFLIRAKLKPMYK